MPDDLSQQEQGPGVGKGDGGTSPVSVKQFLSLTNIVFLCPFFMSQSRKTQMPGPGFWVWEGFAEPCRNGATSFLTSPHLTLEEGGVCKRDAPGAGIKPDPGPVV